MKIVFDFNAQQIGIEGDAPELSDLLTLVRDIAPKLPSISILTGPRHAPGPSLPAAGGNGNHNGAAAASINGGGTSNGGPATGLASQTLRQFVRSLSFTSISEKLTAIAFYQGKVGGRMTFSPKEMGDWFTQCGLEKPAQMAVAVYDAKKKNGFVENAGHGSWKLSTQGENLIIRKIEESL